MLTVVAGKETASSAADMAGRPALAETSLADVEGGSLIDEIVGEGARRMLAAALEAEVAAYIAAHGNQLDERGRRLVVRNGRAVPRQVLTLLRGGGGGRAAGQR